MTRIDLYLIGHIADEKWMAVEVPKGSDGTTVKDALDVLVEHDGVLVDVLDFDGWYMEPAAGGWEHRDRGLRIVHYTRPAPL